MATGHPIYSGIISAIGSTTTTITSAASGPISGAADILLGTSAVARDSIAVANFSRPNNYLSFSQLVSLWHTNWIDDAALVNWAKADGWNLDFGHDDPVIRSKAAFNWTVVKSAHPLPSHMEIIDAYNQGLIDEKNFATLIARAGDKEGIWRGWVDVASGLPGTTDAVQMYRRGIVDKQTAISYIRADGKYQPRQAEEIWQLSQYLPTPSELTMYAVRDVWNPEAVRMGKLDEGYAQLREYRAWMGANGATEVTYTLPGLGPTTTDFARLAWMAHWQVPSPSQGYEFVHRLRPNRIDRYRRDVPGVQPFDLSNLKTLLGIADYAPGYRDQLAAIAFNKPRLIDTRNRYFKGYIDDAELLELMRDYGYNLADAQDIVAYYRGEKKAKDDAAKRKKIIAENGEVIKAILRLFERGIYSRPDAASRLTALGLEREYFDGKLNAIEIRIDMQRVEEYIRSLARKYRSGRLDPREAVSLLVGIGVTSQRARDTVIGWQVRFDAERKIQAAAKVVRWYVDGYITREDAENRLRMYGYTEVDVLLEMDDAENRRKERTAKRDASRAKTEKQKAAAAKKADKEAEKDKHEACKRATTFASLADIKRWLQAGIYTAEDVRKALKCREYIDSDIERYLELWQGKDEEE